MCMLMRADSLLQTIVDRLILLLYGRIPTAEVSIQATIAPGQFPKHHLWAMLLNVCRGSQVAHSFWIAKSFLSFEKYNRPMLFVVSTSNFTLMLAITRTTMFP